MKKSCIFLLHGSRKPKIGEIEEIIKSVDLEEGVSSHIAYLELQQPFFSDVLNQCKEDDEVHILPLFVLEGRHVREDIPEISEKLRKDAPHIKFVVHPHIGQWQLFKDMLNKKILEL
ncbi:CbiX/SirB N-terminal domain-containing protein [Lentisphaera profundi]|uniref:CbiX/SirB N-terminal domain-containing protein n=1 Tax=Lentisphaera profundi TaxID=1658616 RepID=A0ABY7VNJ3_9BACT|nr:CbiX/SirB N-terminal domain-containing protein [Lentisphaera profundi]WDE95477.1 CbiX/SirB N-terminal domain-containing protein [Lentisphaera profundi]